MVYRGKIDEEALKKERFTVSELQERLRGKDVFNLGDVEYAILETNGEVSVIQKPNKRNTIPEDFSIEPEYEGLPYDLIVDGKIMYENLSKIGKDEKWLQKQIVKFKTTPENVLIATMDGKGNFFAKIRVKKEKAENEERSCNYNSNYISNNNWRMADSKLFKENFRWSSRFIKRIERRNT